MKLAKGILGLMGRAERIVCGIAFIVMTGALMADVFKRLAVGAGVLGASEVGVIGMVAVAMFGIGIATDKGAHLRPRFLDGIFPGKWSVPVNQVADLVTSAFFLGLGVLSFLMVAETRALGDVTSILRMPLWPLQTILLVAFSFNAVRYLIFALYPALRASDDVEEAAGGAAEGDVHA
jgi:TRAP-type C4-dicarboxylate transport system permease small subunit